MRSLAHSILAVAWAGVLGFVILVFGAGFWSALVAVNLSVSPSIPWAVPVMSVVLVLMWVYLTGKGWPRGTSQARRLCLRANLVSMPVFTWSVLAGALAVISLAGLWIVMVQLVRMPGNALPDLSRYPLFTVVSLIVMGSVAAPLTERAGLPRLLSGDSRAPVQRAFRSHPVIGPVCSCPRAHPGISMAQAALLLSRWRRLRGHGLSDRIHPAGHSGARFRAAYLFHSDLATRCGSAPHLGNRDGSLVLGACIPIDRLCGARHLGLSTPREGVPYRGRRRSRVSLAAPRMESQPRPDQLVRASHQHIYGCVRVVFVFIHELSLVDPIQLQFEAHWPVVQRTRGMRATVAHLKRQRLAIELRIEQTAPEPRA